MNNRIEIITHPLFLPDRSDPIRSYYFFSYQINIINRSKETVRLLSRYWRIIDGEGNAEDIYGPGVVGKTPTLQPERSFEYTSFCPLPTPLGTMEGSFQMVEANGRQYDAIINPFRLVASQVLN